MAFVFQLIVVKLSESDTGLNTGPKLEFCVTKAKDSGQGGNKGFRMLPLYGAWEAQLDLAFC